MFNYEFFLMALLGKLFKIQRNPRNCCEYVFIRVPTFWIDFRGCLQTSLRGRRGEGKGNKQIQMCGAEHPASHKIEMRGGGHR